MKLDRDFEDDLAESLLDELERKARADIAPRLASETRRLLDEYGRRNDYDIAGIRDAIRTDVTRTDSTVRVTMRLPDPALLFERGTVDHVVEADDAEVLSFIWENPPQWVREEFEQEGEGYRVFLPEVEVSGLPEGRFIRDALHEVRRRLENA